MIAKELAQALYAATRGGDVETIRSLLREHPEALHEPTPLGTWLHIAARHGELDVARFLVDAGLSVDTLGGRSQETALSSAAANGHVEVMRFLIGAGASLDVSEPDRNPLFAAIHGGHTAAAKVLLDAGIDFRVSYTGERMKNMDALAFAREWGRTEIAELLIARGA